MESCSFLQCEKVSNSHVFVGDGHGHGAGEVNIPDFLQKMKKRERC